jgi:hypothetical protein
MSLIFNGLFVAWSGWRLINLDYEKLARGHYILDGIVFSFNLSVILLDLFP